MPIQAHAAGSRDHGRPAFLARFALVLLAPCLPLAAYAAPKTDLIVFMNGDRITGEIKGLEHNRLKISTDHMGTLFVEWDKVARLQSDQHLLLESEDGVRYYGQLKPAKGDGRVLIDPVDIGASPEDVAMTSIVRAQPIEGGDFIDRLDGYMSAGLDLAKANDRRSVDFAAGLSSRTRKREWALDGSMNLTDDTSAETSERYEVQFDYRQLLRERNFYLGFGQLLRNSELDLNLRSTVGGGFGRYLVQTNTSDWSGGFGLAYSHENYTGGEQFDSLEAVLYTSFSVFRYDFPETDIGGTLSVLPSLTQSGRVRSELDLRAKYEFIDDLYFELRMYGSYDSKPPGEATENSDYGLVTSLGYSF